MAPLMTRNPTVVRFGNALLAGCMVFAGASCRQESPKKPEASQPAVTFKPQEVADALHAVIAADREAYARHVVQPLAEAKAANAPEAWKTNGFPPLPEQMLRLASESVQQKGAEFHYVLRSLWPINSKDAPETATEKTGLQYLLDHADSNYYSEESLGGRRYFTAVYPDRAIVPACVQCHNRHPNSPKNDFKPGDIMGGIVVRVPLEF
jgi:hypothetical protein